MSLHSLTQLRKLTKYYYNYYNTVAYSTTDEADAGPHYGCTTMAKSF